MSSALTWMDLPIHTDPWVTQVSPSTSVLLQAARLMNFHSVFQFQALEWCNSFFSDFIRSQQLNQTSDISASAEKYLFSTTHNKPQQTATNHNKPQQTTTTRLSRLAGVVGTAAATARVAETLELRIACSTVNSCGSNAEAFLGTECFDVPWRNSSEKFRDI